MRKIILILTIFITALFLTSCIPLTSQLIKLEEAIISEDIKSAENISHIGFVTGEVNDENEKIIMNAEDFSAPVAECSKYRSSLIYNTLSENEKIVYNALEYAMENCYTSIMVEYSLIDNFERITEILSLLSMDSPLVEQNLFYKYGTFVTFHTLDTDTFFSHQIQINGIYITIDNFSKEWWDKKQEAIKAAQTIVDALPAELTPAEKAQNLYLQIAMNTEYSYSDVDMKSVQPNLYNTLINHKSHCDGYTNALSLLYNMAGINCAEKVYEPADNNIGHTWNCFEIDGKWYNADATGTDNIPIENPVFHGGINFGFADELQKYAPKHADIFPQCSDNLHFPIDARFASLEDESFSDTLYECYKTHDYNWAFIMADSFDEVTHHSKMQNLADRIQKNIQYVIFHCINNKTAVFIYDPNY